MNVPVRPIAPPRPASSPEASLNLLMSLFAVKPSAWLAQAVVTQLELLAVRPPRQRAGRDRPGNYRDLLPAWQGIARRLRALEPMQA